MVFLFKVKKRLLTKIALKKEKRKLIKEAQARIESDELSSLMNLRNRISKAKNINIPQNVEQNIKRKKTTLKRLRKEAGLGFKVGVRSTKTLFKELGLLNKSKRVTKKKVMKKMIKRKIKKRIKKGKRKR